MRCVDCSSGNLDNVWGCVVSRAFRNEMSSLTWYADDARMILAEMETPMAGAWVKILNKAITSDDPGTLELSSESLSVILGMKKEEMMPVLVHMAMRLRKTQREAHGHTSACTAENFQTERWLTGHLMLWVDGEEVTETTGRGVAGKVTGWEQLRVEMPRKKQDEMRTEESRQTWKLRKRAQRGVCQETESRETCKRDTKTTIMSQKEGVKEVLSTDPPQWTTPLVPHTPPVDKGLCPGDITIPITIPIIPPIPPLGELVLGSDSETGEKCSLRRPSGARQKRQTGAVCTPEMNRIGAWFGHKPGTGWTVEDQEAWERVAKTGIVQPGDFEALEWYYTTAAKRYGRRNYTAMQKNGFYPCRHLMTLLGKWRPQVEKALERKREERNDELME